MKQAFMRYGTFSVVGILVGLMLAPRSHAQNGACVADEVDFATICWEAKPMGSAVNCDRTCKADGQDSATYSSGSTWARAEYLLWWTKGNQLPAILTTSPAGTPRADAGVLGVAGTEVLFGQDSIDSGERSGLRISVGHWLDADRQCGLEATYFSVFDDTSCGDLTAETAVPGSGLPILARPFYDVTLDAENSRLVSFPGVVDGRINISSSSELHSGSLVVRRQLASGCRGQLDFLAGYRYLRLREGLHSQEDLVVTEVGGLIQQGTTFEIYDHFVAENDFHGGDLGLAARYGDDRWNLELLAKVALGNLHRVVSIDGGTVRQSPPPGGISIDDAGGMLALASNIGERADNRFAALPEFGINVSYRCNDFVQLLGGYSLVMLTGVARTGEQIDHSVNPTQFPGSAPAGEARPMSLFDNTTDFWAQGLSCGVMLQR